MPVTREELADHVGGAFGHGTVTRASLIACAAASGARPEVVQVIGILPNGGLYARLRDLWPDLPGVPVDAEEAARR